ncbi:hypothetical protein V8C43DRAFT_274335 [Trichoderma afarasin]
MPEAEHSEDRAESHGSNKNEDGEDSSSEDNQSDSEVEEENDEPTLTNELWTAGINKVLDELTANDIVDEKGFQDRLKEGENEKYITWTADSKFTSLHKLAEQTYDRGEKTKFLVEYLVNKHPEYMEIIGVYNLRPLDLAISGKNESFITHVLDSKFGCSPQMTKAIAQNGPDNNNGIHVAITSDLNPSLTVKLIEKSNEDTLSQKNSAGYTPIHLAVEYAKCKKGQLDVVLALLRRGNAALDQECGKPYPGSPYIYHHATRKAQTITDSGSSNNAQNKDFIINEPNATRSSSLTASAGEVSVEPAKRDVHSTPVGKKVDYKLLERRASSLNPDLSSTPMKQTETPPATPKMSPQELPKQNPGMKDKQASVNENELPEIGSTNVKDISKKRKKKKSAKKNKPTSLQSQLPPDVDEANSIAKELKLHYLRSIFSEPTNTTEQPRTHATAVKFLHGDNRENRHICFDLLGESSQWSEEKFKRTFDSFTFDSILQYVAFGGIKFTKTDLPPRKSTSMSRSVAKASVGQGRSDMEIPFKWLKEKHVCNIVMVIVLDQTKPSHTDQSIEKALKPFEIDILDWRKFDLCSETIFRACENLREVHLYWTGRNAVLRAWSEPDGLVKLKKLRRIQIHEVMNLETEERTEENMTAFGARIKKQRKLQQERFDRNHIGDIDYPDIIISDPIKPQPLNKEASMGIKTQSDIRAQKMTHDWLTIMDKFADGIWKLWPKDDAINTSLPLELGQDVAVALIDDGVRISHDSLHGRIIGGRSFDDGYNGIGLPGAERPFHESPTGHGTLMANMICRVCPNVKLYVCRLNLYNDRDGRPHFTAKSTAEAINHCISQGYRIISMSWTIKSTVENGHDETDQDIKDLQNAIKNAISKGALLFCAAPDEGNKSDATFRQYYPVGYSSCSHQMFKIGAAASTNKAWEKTGRVSQLDFLLPGHEVEPRMGDRIEIKESGLQTGSSIATALAAGLAALVIYCVQLAAIESYQLELSDKSHQTTKTQDNDTRQLPINRPITIEDLQSIQTFDSMSHAFRGIHRSNSVNQVDDNYLDVERLFSPLCVKLHDNTLHDMEKKGIIMELARKLLYEAGRK